MGDLDLLREYADSSQKHFITIQKLCDVKNIPFVVLVFPSEHGFSKRKNNYSNIDDYSFPTRILTNDLRKFGINAIDLWPFMLKNSYLKKDAHLNVNGHKIVYNELKDLLELALNGQ